MELEPVPNSYRKSNGGDRINHRSFSHGTWTSYRFIDPSSYRKSKWWYCSPYPHGTWTSHWLIDPFKLTQKIWLRLHVQQSLLTWNLYSQEHMEDEYQPHICTSSVVQTHKTARNWPLCKDTHCAVTCKKERVQSRHAVPQAHFKVLLVPCEHSLTFQTHCMSVRWLGTHSVSIKVI